jgi:trigger factor
MKAQAEKIDNYRVELEVEVDNQKFEEGINKAYKKLVKKVNIPGFRKGKVPKHVLINYIGKEAIYNEAVEFVVPDAYYEAVEETGIEPVDQPELEIIQLEEDKPFVFKAKVIVKPEAELGEYKGLEIEHKDTEIKEEDIDNYLKNIQERHARMVTVDDRSVEKGDTVIIDFEGFIDGEPFQGGKGEDYSLEIGSQTFIPGFEEQVEGMKLNDEKDISVTFPDEYHQKNLAGKEAVFNVKLKEIKKKELLPLDDEFAKDVSEFDTLQELREDAEKKLKERAEQDSQNMLKNKVINKVSENVNVDIPEVLIEKRIDGFIQEMEQGMRNQGLTVEKYLEITNSSMEELRKGYHERAKESVKADLTLEAVAKKEGITVSDEELDKELEKMASLYNQEKDKIKEMLEMQGNLESFKNSIVTEKTLDYLVEQSVVVEPKPEDEADKELSKEDEGKEEEK